MSDLSNVRFQLNEPTAAAQVASGELLLINFESGRYYAANAAATVLWELIVETRLTLEEVTQWLPDNNSETVELIEAMIQDWVQEQLITPTVASPRPVPAGLVWPNGKPEVDVFSDLEELLRLDPIHDVDEAGWPMVVAS